MTFITTTTVISIMKLKGQNHWKQQPKVVPLQQQPPPQQLPQQQPLQLQQQQPRPLLQQLQGEFVIDVVMNEVLRLGHVSCFVFLQILSILDKIAKPFYQL